MDSIATMILPLFGTQWMLPKVSVSEVIPFSRLHHLPEVPDWLLGNMNWRGLSIPAVNIELFEDSAAPFSKKQPNSFAVMYTLAKHSRFPFVAVALQSLPHSIRIREDDELRFEFCNRKLFCLMATQGTNSYHMAELEPLHAALLAALEIVE